MKKRLICSLLQAALLLVMLACSEPSNSSSLEQIKERGTLLVGSTGDYRPLSYLEPTTNQYWGFDVELAEIIAKDLGVKIQYVPTSWPTLTQDMLNEKLFDIAICGISITDARKEIMLMSDGYLHNGKTILCRKADEKRFQTLDDINKPDVVVMVNPGGLNEKFAKEHLTKAKIVVHQKNEEIPSLVAKGEADIMITEIVEAPYYVQNDARLAAPLIDKPFTNGEIGVLMRKGNEELLKRINGIIDRCKKDGTLKRLHDKYGFNF
ncbi:MAG: transporter substrate-binding domain-containing protein [Bacteroidaceae bacterium]|nr:transporter substrate-binding domain-containing protein [Bacteroidaceae bacterium]